MWGAIRSFIREEGGKLKNMTFNEKRIYIWEYYKWTIGAIVLGGILIGMALNTWIFNPRKDDFLYIAWLGEPITQPYLDALRDELLVANLVVDPEQQTITVFSYANTHNAQANMQLRTRFVANMAAGNMDVILLTYEGVLEVAELGWIQPMDALLQALGDIDPVLHDNIVARVWDISVDDVRGDVLPLVGSPLLYALDFDVDDLYLSIAINSQHIYRIAQLVQVLFHE